MIWAILTLFCLLTLFIGWRSSIGIKSLRDYLLANQSVGSFALFSTIVASFVGGGVVMGTAEKAFQFGIGHALALCGFGLQLMLTGLWVAPRMTRFRHVLSLGDVIAQYYGKIPQILTGILWLSFCVGILTAQMCALGNLVTSLLGFDRTLGILISAGIVVFYCAVGGIRAVVATDLLQFILLSIALGLVSYFGISHLGGWESFIQQIPATHLSPTGFLSTSECVLIFCSFLLGDALIPPVFQRLLISKTERAAQNAYIGAGLMIIPISFLAASHGLIAFVMDPAIPKDHITISLFQHTLPAPMAILAILGFFAVIMSSADTYLNAAAGSLVNDIVIPIKKKNTLSTQQALRLAKWTTVLVGSMSIFFAIAVQDIFDILLKTYQFWGPTLVVPLIGILCNKTLPPYGFYASVLAGGSTVVVWNTWDLETSLHVSPLIAGLVANVLMYSVLFFFHRRNYALTLIKLSNS